MSFKGALFINSPSVIILLGMCCLVSAEERKKLELFHGDLPTSYKCYPDKVEILFKSNVNFQGYAYVDKFKRNPQCVRRIERKNITKFTINANKCGFFANNTLPFHVTIVRDAETKTDNFYSYSFLVSCPSERVSIEKLHTTAAFERIKNINKNIRPRMQILNEANENVTIFNFGEPLKVKVISENAHQGVIPKDCYIHDAVNGSMSQKIFENKCSMDNLIGEWHRVPGDPLSVQSTFTGFSLINNYQYKINCTVDVCDGPCSLPNHCEEDRRYRRRRRALYGRVETP